MKLILNKVVT